MKYICEICNEDFKTEKECEIHESKHELEALKKLTPEGAIICPSCKGTGDATGSDGCDYRSCYTCHGKKFVIPEIVTKTIYKPI